MTTRTGTTSDRRVNLDELLRLSRQFFQDIRTPMATPTELTLEIGKTYWNWLHDTQVTILSMHPQFPNLLLGSNGEPYKPNGENAWAGFVTNSGHLIEEVV